MKYTFNDKWSSECATFHCRSDNIRTKDNVSYRRRGWNKIVNDNCFVTVVVESDTEKVTNSEKLERISSASCSDRASKAPISKSKYDVTVVRRSPAEKNSVSASYLIFHKKCRATNYFQYRASAMSRAVGARIITASVTPTVIRANWPNAVSWETELLW